MGNNKLSVRRNIISNIILFLLNSVIGIWMPPFLIARLGVGAYGLIPLATSLIGYVSIITVAINGSLSRFLSIDVNSKDYEQANRTFNTASTSLGLMFLVLLPIVVMFSLQVSRFISVPSELGYGVNILFLCAGASFTLSSFSSIFNTSGYIANRLDLVNRVSVISTYVRVALVLIIFLLINVSLEGYGISLLVASITSSCYSYYIFKKYTPFIKIDIKLFDIKILKSLMSMGWWLMIIQLGSILFLQIDLIVINKLLGADSAGKYSVLLQWSNMIRMLSLMLSGALGPLILNLYAKKHTDQMIKLTKLSNKLLTLFITCIVLTLCIFSKYLLNLWVGPEFSNMSYLFILMLLPLPLNLGVLPLFLLNRAYNRVRLPGIVTCCMGVANFLIALFFVKYTNLGMYGVAAASGIVLTLKNFIFMPIYTAKTIGIKYTSFYGASISSFLLVMLGAIIGFAYWTYFDAFTWVSLIFNGAIIFSIFVGVSYLLLIKDERKILFDTIINRKQK
ncbi:oligosaccharide flippase family protein [Pedobacter sp. MC2016-05]|uniref:oligosaccharide flippase family protein n=1 Tax=Pedobacter sp. MC2016-05 TaxID=2994474 RepID=UPI002247B891|nr:oligosaccharide flippase family protein [Pedobacter sp. MC2016-05]MCX2473226.1 oligosaccharide flippase family protein [Pedobacter sp. MC2016-05]